MHVIRQSINLAPSESLFLFIDGIIPPISAMVLDMYCEHMDEDGFLYVTYSSQDSFG